jgi:hypothetical protein
MGTEGYLCHECIGDKYLKHHIRTTHKAQLCSGCSKKRKAMPLEMVGSALDEVLQRDFVQVRPDSYWQSGEELNFVVQEVMGVEPHVAALAIRAAQDLEDSYTICKDGGTPFYDDTAEYRETHAYAGEYKWTWEAFCHNVKHTSRFFSDTAEARLHEIFQGLNRFQARDGRKPVRRLEPTDTSVRIYRARTAETVAAASLLVASPSSTLGPPPSGIAVPGRMNPAGISVFYGGFDIETCISEILPAVGSFVVLAAFTRLRPLQILDLTALDEAYTELSYFQPDFQQITEQLAFLRSFHAQVARAVTPSDEALRYIPTQVVAEFLAHRHDPGIDGLLYASAQRGGLGMNIVLFHHASVVEAGAEVEVDGPVLGYLSDEEDEEPTLVLPPSEHKPVLKQPISTALDFETGSPGYRSDVARVPTLRLEPDSLRMRRVSGTTYAHENVSIVDLRSSALSSGDAKNAF